MKLLFDISLLDVIGGGGEKSVTCKESVIRSSDCKTSLRPDN